VLLLVGAAVGAWLSVGTGTAAPPQSAAPVTVAIQVLKFVPQEITIPVGTRVTCRWQLLTESMVLSAFSSAVLTTAQQKFVYQFCSGGVSYHCFSWWLGARDVRVVTVVERTLGRIWPPCLDIAKEGYCDHAF
jgi:hypothetical protein